MVKKQLLAFISTSLYNLIKMGSFTNQHDYFSYLGSIGSLPDGFSCATSSLTFLPVEREEPYKMNMGAVLLDEPTKSFAGVFTRNSLPGAPVLIGRRRLGEEFSQGVLVNNRISNVAVRGGRETAERLVSRLGALRNISPNYLFSSSTGIIGWSLPEAEMLESLDELDKSWQRDNFLPFAKAIMTTDRYPKLRVRQCGGARITAIAKGAGMIEPNLATMLCFIFTDAAVDRSDLRRILSDSVEDSFNSISVDSDQSTSDMVLAFGSGKKEVKLSEFRSEFRELCREISMDIVRNGEGCAHVLRIHVGGHRDGSYCRGLGKAVGNSALVKTAVYGNDPNVGRILSALGDYAGNAGKLLDSSVLSIYIGKQAVFAGGAFYIDKEKEELLSDYLQSQAQNPRISGYPQHDRCVDIRIDLGVHKNAPGYTVIASDLGHEYVSENADYRS